MAPKRKTEEDKPAEEEGPRRSTRSAPNSASAPAAKPASAAKAKPASKEKPASKGKPASKAKPESKEKPASKGKAGASKPASKGKPAPEKEKEEEAEAVSEPEKAEEPKEEEQPAAKKAKTSSVLAVGDVVPDLSLKNQDGEDVSIKSLYDKSGLVIFSYPKANTPGCTTQACGYRDHYDEISKLGYTVLGLSADPPKSQLSWKTSKNFQYSLLSDPSKELLKQLGATDAKKRCHWIVEKGGKLLEAAIGVQPKTDPENAIKFIEGLKK